MASDSHNDIIKFIEGNEEVIYSVEYHSTDCKDNHTYVIGYIPSQETFETYQKRIALISTINESERYVYLSSSLERRK